MEERSGVREDLADAGGIQEERKRRELKELSHQLARERRKAAAVRKDLDLAELKEAWRRRRRGGRLG